MLTVAEATQKIEHDIRETLTRIHPNHVTVFQMYEHISKGGKYGIVTTGFFNRIVADMKKTGIIGTARGGDIMFISEAAKQASEETSKETAATEGGR